MFRRTICALTAWAATTGTVNAQPPGIEPVSARKSIPEPDMGPLPARVNPEFPGYELTGLPRARRFGRPLPVFASTVRQPEPPPTTKPTSDSPPKPPVADTAAPTESTYLPRPVVGALPKLPSGHVWTRLEMLVWSASGQHVPPAITSSPPGTPQNFAGIVSNPGTEVLFPTDRTNNEFRGGFRLLAGAWLNSEQSVGIEGDFLFLINSKKGLTVASDFGGNQIIARPFFNALTNAPDALLGAFPNQSRGVLSVRTENWIAGGGVNMLYDTTGDPCHRLDLLAGYRYLGVFDEVEYEQDSTGLVPGPTFGNRVQLLDRFNAENNFHGFNLGFDSERTFGVWFVGLRASAAIGGVQQIRKIDGRAVVTPAVGVPNTTFQGLYAQSTNIGQLKRTWFAVLPEVGLRTGVQFSESARFYFGYNWIYLSSVVRAGDQIDTRVNPNLLPGSTTIGGPLLPNLPRLKKTDFWIQGVSFGMEVTF